MAWNGLGPPPCDPEIFEKGKVICTLEGDRDAIEHWVQTIARMAHTKLDWCYQVGRATVLHLGNYDSRQRALCSIKKMRGTLEGSVLGIDAPIIL